MCARRVNRHRRATRLERDDVSSECCARAARGHAPHRVMNSRRLMGLPPNRAGVDCHKGHGVSWAWR